MLLVYQVVKTFSSFMLDSPDLTDFVSFYAFCVLCRGPLPSDLHLLCHTLSIHYYIDTFVGGLNATDFCHNNLSPVCLKQNKI